MLTEIQIQKKREHKADRRRNIGYRGPGKYTGARNIVGNIAYNFPPPGVPTPMNGKPAIKQGLLARLAGHIGKVWNRKV